MNKIPPKIKDILLRYSIILLIGIFGLQIILKIFLPLTLHASHYALSLFFKTVVINNILLLNGEFPIELIDACVGVSAYFLLFVLGMSLPKMTLKKRTKLILHSFALFFVANIIRIVVLSAMVVSGSNFFEITHKFSWYFIGTLMVAIIWFYEVSRFKINEIPFYTDMNFLYKKSTFKK